MRGLSLILAMLLSVVVASGQMSKEATRTLEKDLFKKTPYVRSARLEKCRLILTVDVANSTGFNPLTGTMPGAMPTEGVMTTDLVTGSGSRNLIRFDLDLIEFDTSGVVVATTKRKEHSILMLTGKSKQAVLRTWSGKKDRSNSVDLTAYAKDAPSLADSIRGAISACKKPI